MFHSRAEKILSLLPKPAVDSGEESSDGEEQNYMDSTASCFRETDTNSDIQNLMTNFDVMFDNHPIEIGEVLNILDEIGEPDQNVVQEEPDIPIFQPTVGRKRKVHKKKKTSKIVRPQFEWKKEPFMKAVTLPEKNLHVDIESAFDDQPIHYFYKFFSEELIELITYQTNLYCTQKGNGQPAAHFTKDDVLDFLAILLISGVVGMPDYNDYWSSRLRYNKIADIMPRNKFKLIRRYLHFADNGAPSNDRYYKIRPVLESVRQKCLILDEETKFSIDEMMVPYKGKKAGSRRQYIKNKPVKWGFKIFVRAGVTGMIYDFLIYNGKETFSNIKFTKKEENCFTFSEQVVISLCKTIKDKPLSVAYFDNWFSTPDLLAYLRGKYGILSLATVRNNRTRGAPLETDSNMKKAGRGTYTELVDNKKGVSLIKWYDNKGVITASTYKGSQPVGNISRWSKEMKQRTPVACPAQIKEYNSHMGGVDLADMLVALYRTNYRSHKWYLNIFSQLLDIAVNNAWLLFRREHPDSKLRLKEFRIQVADDIVLFCRPKKRPSSSRTPLVAKKMRLTAEAIVPDATRLDGIEHWPCFDTKGRCRLCHVNQTVIRCVKCNVRLCNTRERTCFLNFHGKVF